MRLVPISLREARRFVAEHHRHNAAPHAWKFGVGLAGPDGLVGVAMGGPPVSRNLDDGLTIEVSRVCTLGDKNANSQLYGAILRAATALGYTKAITYTLPDESGSSLKAVGFVQDGETAGGSWSRPSRPRVTEDLFGETKYDLGPKTRWVKVLGSN